jgi:uncharacterized membrane protein
VDHRHPPPQPRNEFFFQDGPYHGHDAWWHGLVHGLFALVLVALLVLAVIWLVRRLSPAAAQAATPAVVPASGLASAGTSAASDPAVATLRMRYAKGEVSREDYQHAIQDLTGAAPAAWPGDSPPEDTPAES